MSDTIRQPIPQTGSITPNEATFLGGILRKGDFIGGWAIESKIPVNSGEAELYMAKKDGHTGVIKYYRSPDFKPKDEIVKTLLSWKHEDVIQLLDTGRHNNLFFEAMEYAAGGAIDSRDASGYRYLPLSEEETAQMVREVSNAFKACHEAGIIHRDIKPANIFYRNEDGSDFVIGDFGISSQLDMEARLSSRLTQNLNRTEGYAAPEVYSGVIKGPVDYYALGITVWEVMTGTVAFEGRNPNHVSRDTIEGRIIDDLLSRDESADFSDKMKTLLKGLLTHKHDKRWGYEQVQDWLDGKDVPVYSQRPEIKVPPYKFEGQELTSLAKVAEALLVSPEAGKKALFRGVIEGWLAAFDQDLAMKVGDIKENLGETAKDKALRQVALTLNPGQPFVTAGGKAIESFFEFAKVIQTEPEELVEHLRNPDDGLWDFFEIWGAGAIIEALKPMLGSVKSQKRLVNMMVVALKGNVIMPFEATRFAGTELSSLGQLETLPKECQKRFMMELEDQNGLLAVWLEAVSGRGYPKEWGNEGLPAWKDIVRYWLSEANASLASRESGPWQEEESTNKQHKTSKPDRQLSIGDSHAGGIVALIDGRGGGMVACPFDSSDKVGWDSAKELCRKMNKDGHRDWRLPTIDELVLLHENLDKAGKANFISSWYWSSTKGSDDNAWRFNFSNGEKRESYRNNDCAVRPVRDF